MKLHLSFILFFFFTLITTPSITHSFTILSKSKTSIHPITTKPTSSSSTTTSSSSTTQLYVFDFFKERATEGISQLQNLSTKTSQGKLIEGLTDVATYTTTTNTNFAIGLTKSRNQLLYNIENIINGGGDIIEELEDILLQADLGMKTSIDVMEEVKSLRLDSTDIFSRDDLRSVLRGKLIEALQPNAIIVNDDTTNGTDGDIDGVDDIDDGTHDGTNDGTNVYNPAAIRFASPTENNPTILFIMGANGMGKTTTIGKLASRLKTEGNQSILLAACDTFRAGAVEQLEMWSERAEVDCYSPNDEQKTPAAVLYGALDKAISEKYDTLIVDTSGRLSNNDALTEELLKMKRVIQKRLSKEKDDTNGKPILNTNVPHETLLVIDAAQGRMALESAKTWHEEIGLTGLVLTKLDGSARGGSVVAVSRELGLPVKLIGIGEKIEDLRDFDPEAFVDGLLGIGLAGGSSNKNEGKILANRLVEMRKARDDRAVQLKQQQQKKVVTPAVASAANGSNVMDGMTLDTSSMNDITATANNNDNNNPRRSKGNPNKSNKKKKKKKNKK